MHNYTASMWMSCSLDNPCLLPVTPAPVGWCPVRGDGGLAYLGVTISVLMISWFARSKSFRCYGKGRKKICCLLFCFGRNYQTGMHSSLLTGGSLWGSKCDGAWGYWVEYVRNWREGVFCSRSSIWTEEPWGSFSVGFFVFMHK